jgi:hypothetical protein
MNGGERIRRKDVCRGGGIQIGANMGDKAQEYRERAEDCRREAERCSTPIEKNQWLILGDQWLSMARKLDMSVHKFAAPGTGDA